MLLVEATDVNSAALFCCCFLVDKQTSANKSYQSQTGDFSVG